ncbi:hypothetical protein [Bartonella sp. CB178]
MILCQVDGARGLAWHSGLFLRALEILLKKRAKFIARSKLQIVLKVP